MNAMLRDDLQSGAEPPRVVLFDFDGVLSRGDAFGAFVRERYRAWWRKGIVTLCLPGLLLVLPFSRRRVLQILVRVGLLGLSESRYRAQAQAFASTLVRRPHQFHREAWNELRRHQSAGDRVIVVTGCEETLVRAIIDGLAVGEVEVLASRLRASRLGMRAAWHNIGHNKVESLAQHGIEAWQLAYGDSLQDVPMLERADEAVLVNATTKLRHRVERAIGHPATQVEWY